MNADAASDKLTSFFQNGHGGAAHVNDQDAIEEVREFINRHVPEGGEGDGWLFIEMLGGAMTPAFTGRPQAHVYRPLGFPVVLSGSSGPNGVSLTISAYESLQLRLYNVIALVVFKEETWKNYRYLDQYFGRHHPSVRVVMLPAIPPSDAPNPTESLIQLYRTVTASEALAPVLHAIDILYQ